MSTNYDLNNLIGKRISNIYISKYDDCMNETEFEYDEKIKNAIYWDKNATENVEIEFDSHIIIQVEDIYVKFVYMNGDNFQITATNTLEENVLNISHYYSKNIINKKITSVKMTKKGYQVLLFTLENNFILILHNVYSYRTGLYISELKNNFKEQYKHNSPDMYYEGTFEHYSDLKPGLDKIKNYFVGKNIDNIMWYGNYTFYYPHYDKIYSIVNSIEGDMPVVIQAGGHHFAISYHDDSCYSIEIDYYNFTEHDSENDDFWHISNTLYPRIIGQKIKDVFTTRFDYEDLKEDYPEYYNAHKDDFADIIVELENGYYFVISNWEYDTIFYQAKKEEYLKKIRQDKRYISN